MAEGKKKTTTAKRTSRQPAKPKKITENENAKKKVQDESIDKKTVDNEKPETVDKIDSHSEKDPQRRGRRISNNDVLLETSTQITNQPQTVNEESTQNESEQKSDEINRDVDITKAYVNNSRPVIELVAALSYILFFLPLIFCRREPFALYHANQSLVFWIFMIALYLIFGFIPSVNVVALPIIIIFHVLGIFYGMYNSAHGRARPFFLIGKITIIKWS